MHAMSGIALYYPNPATEPMHCCIPSLARRARATIAFRPSRRPRLRAWSFAGQSERETGESGLVLDAHIHAREMGYE